MIKKLWSLQLKNQIINTVYFNIHIPNVNNIHFQDIENLLFGPTFYVAQTDDRETGHQNNRSSLYWRVLKTKL